MTSADPVTALGLMSGTSMDGVDAAIVTTDGTRILQTGPWATTPYAPDLRDRLAQLVAAGGDAAPDVLAALEAELTDANAAAVNKLLADNGLSSSAISVVGFHGQTILHRPERRLTRQLGDGDRLAASTGIAVVNDFRSADVAAGGEGAPFAPLFHMALSDSLEKPLAILNLGGVGNLTYIGPGGPEDVLAFDTGPGNALMDDWVERHTGETCDLDGKLAAAGTVHGDRLKPLLEQHYFDRRPPKSLDRNDFSADPLEGLSVEDGAATLASFTALSVARGLEHLPARPHRWLVTGGGRHNPVLMRLLGEALEVPVDPVEAEGWQGDALEAQAFAFLAVRSRLGLPLSLPSTTGVPRPMTGGRFHEANRAA